MVFSAAQSGVKRLQYTAEIRRKYISVSQSYTLLQVFQKRGIESSTYIQQQTKSTYHLIYQPGYVIILYGRYFVALFWSFYYRKKQCHKITYTTTPNQCNKQPPAFYRVIVKAHSVSDFRGTNGYFSNFIRSYETDTMGLISREMYDLTRYIHMQNIGHTGPFLRRDSMRYSLLLVIFLAVKNYQ